MTEEQAEIIIKELEMLRKAIRKLNLRRCWA
jgi:hypothetical protein